MRVYLGGKQSNHSFGNLQKQTSEQKTLTALEFFSEVSWEGLYVVRNGVGDLGFLTRVDVVGFRMLLENFRI